MFAVLFNFLRNIAIYAKDASAVDEYLGEDVEHAIVNLPWGRHQQGHKGKDDAKDDSYIAIMRKGKENPCDEDDAEAEVVEALDSKAGDITP